MKFSYTWLGDYFDTPLPSGEELGRALTMHSFEIEGIESHGADSILDIKVLPNRAHDCLSYWGMAREIGVVLNTPVKIPEVIFTGDTAVSTNGKLSLAVENTTLVPRALKRYAEGVTVGESPAWLKEKLAAQGQRSINAVVDATNLVMFETGQPVHAFDYDKLAKGEDGRAAVSLRLAKEGETMITLDGKQLTLDSTMLVVADGEKALDIAGVKGGAISGIDEHTSRLMLSVCNYNPVNIRKTAKALGLRTDASVRFENGVAPELAETAMERLSQLIAELTGGKVAADIAEVYPLRKNPYRVGVSLSEINTALGTQLTRNDVAATFNRFTFTHEIVKPLKKILDIAPLLVGVPYKYGASVLSDAPHAFDCSSLVAYLYAQAGVAIPRVAVDQFVFGTPVEASDLQPGDVIFSDRAADGTTEHIENLGIDQVRRTKVTHDFMPGTEVPSGIDHNGIYLGDGKVLHASGKWHEGKVIIEPLAQSKAFETIVGYRRMILNTEERFVVTVPVERLDIRIKEDLIEEIGRIVGLENIPSEQLPSIDVKPLVNANEYYKTLVRQRLTEMGFSEVYTYAFQAKGTVEVANPLAEDKKYLRATLGNGLAAALEVNKKNKPLIGIDTVKIFEIGTVFSQDGPARGWPASGWEQQEIGIAVEKEKELAAACAAVDAALGVSCVWKKEGTVATASFTDAIRPLSVPRAYTDIPKLPSVVFTPISTYPFILRDIAVWVENSSKFKVESLKSEQASLEAKSSQLEAESPLRSTDYVLRTALEELIKTRGAGLLMRMDLFDTFEKEGRTSYAYHLVFQSYEKTLSDDEINVIMKAIENDIREKGWEVR